MLLAATAASAQDPTDPDTELTPKAKEPTQWSLIGGAKYKAGGKPVNDASPTSYDVDFFSTSFSPSFIDDSPNEEGFFAGAECIDGDVPFEDEALRNCERRPAIYRFWIDEVGDEHIEKVPTDELLGERDDEQGFVGAIAWIDGKRALAVGGTGAYPRREPSAAQPKPGESPDAAYLRKDKEGEPCLPNQPCDQPAGHARAWLYEDPDGEGEATARWREITDQLPADQADANRPMGALTALECRHQQASDAHPKGTCLAGGMHRMWWWRPKGQAPEGFDPDPVSNLEVAGGTTQRLGSFSGSPEVRTPDNLTNPRSKPDFHHRVRQIRFSRTDAVAVTSGCCAERVQIKSGQNGVPEDADAALGGRILKYDGAGWKSEPFSTQTYGEDAGAATGKLPDSLYGVLNDTSAVGTGAEHQFESFSLNAGVASPGGTSTPGVEEPGARIVSQFVASACCIEGEAATSTAALDNARLVAIGKGHGAAEPKGPAQDATGQAGTPLSRAQVLWTVGSLKQGSLEGTAQGIAYTNLEPPVGIPPPLSCPLLTFAGGGDCRPVPENLGEKGLQSKRLIGMGTYALNSLAFIFRSKNAWAAGDRGALARLGSAGKLGAEPEPEAPALRPGKTKPLGDRAPYEAKRPAANDPGAVPPLASRPIEKLPRKTMVPYGSADPSRFTDGARVEGGGLKYEAIASMAMSRDGSEGWAVGSGAAGDSVHAGNTLTLQHFDGERWTRCAIDGLAGAHEPDPACASLASLPRLENEQSPLLLYKVARIPLERDSDPTNDDEFAAMAIGVGASTNLTKVLSYRDGVWTVDEPASAQIPLRNTDRQNSLAFHRPDDGWLLVNEGSNANQARVYHYGGGDWPNGRWVQCTLATRQECGEIDDLIGNANSAEGGVAGGHLQLAGDAVLIAGTRTKGATGDQYPAVFSREVTGTWIAEYDPGCVERVNRTCQARTRDVGYDPLRDSDRGVVRSFTAVDLGGGRVAGWLVGRFGEPQGVPFVGGAFNTDDYNRPLKGPNRVLMRRDPDAPVGSKDAWSMREVEDAADDLLPFERVGGPGDPPRSLISFAGPDGRERAFMTSGGGRVMATYYPPLEYDPAKDRWQVMPAPFSATTKATGGLDTSMVGEITAMAPDGKGGVWVAARGNHAAPDAEPSHKFADMQSHRANFYYRYTDKGPRALFEESSSPISEEITDLDGARDGTVWVSTGSERLYRYDRMAGWERVSIPEWDPGRVVTRRSKAFAVAVNDSGEGIAVGEQGRIANFSAGGVTLDPASANRCSESPPPCGTPRNLRAAEVAPDGSAMAGGDRLTLTWRPAGGQFRLIDAPRSSAFATITDISMPDPTRAWASLDNGEIWAGVLVDPTGPRPWRWRRESTASAAKDEAETLGAVARLFGIEVDSQGRGLAVGARGAMLERSPDGGWKRLVTGFLDNLYSVELPPQGYGDGAVVGGWLGVILTRSDGRFHIARPADRFDPITSEAIELWSGRIVGVTIAGGDREGETEVWAASQTGLPDGYTQQVRRPAPHALLHYASSDNPLLHPERRARLADAPSERPGELAVASFGRSDCQLQRQGDEINGCRPFAGTSLFHEIISRRIDGEVIERSRRSAIPITAVSTGDLTQAAGREDREILTPVGVGYVHTINQPNILQRQWRQFVADPLLENDVPILAALGERDLSRARFSNQLQGYNDTRELAAAGNPLQWRHTFASMPAPWGKAEPFANEDYEYRPVPGSPTAVEYPDKKVEDPTKPVPEQTVEDPTKGTEDPTVSPPHPGDQKVGTTTVPDPTKNVADQTVKLPRPGDRKLPPRTGDKSVEGGAHTHYALDVVRKSDGKAISRIVVADTSNLRSLAASDANQNPVEPQQAWLEQVLCIEGSATDTGACTRAQEMPAVVVTTTPPYSYGAGAVEQTQQEAAAFEALMLRHRVTTLITGHMGWNGLYYTFAPSLHFPQPGGEHPDSTRPPTGPGDDRGPDPGQLPVDPSDLTGDDAVTGVLPTVIASSAGSRFGPRGDDSGSASQGYWHGYSVVRVPPDGASDPSKVIVEQRPILDWINITAKSHVLRPRQRLKLEGIGREPYGADTSIQIDEINSPAITHCYDLVYADPDKPWLPLQAEDASEEQLAGQGEGCHTREPAAETESSSAAADSADEDSAGECHPYVCLPASIGTINDQTGDVRAGSGNQDRTFGLAVLSVGEKSATWPISFEPRPSFSPPRVPPPPPPQPPPPPPVPANPPIGTVGNLSLPTPPAFPNLPLGAELVPPAPPIPLPPPGAANVAPLNLFLSVPGINIAPQSTVIPPPAPPIQPAPPGGARKEARQRQAAAQKSGSDVGEESREIQSLGGDQAAGMPGAPGEMTRRDRVQPGQSFTPMTHRHQPSAWATGLQWGGGMTLAALVLYFGWITVRPTPRRRTPELPAPAFARAEHPRRRR